MDKKVYVFISNACWRAHRPQMRSCVEAVSAKVERDIFTFCEQNAASEQLTAEACRQRLSSFVWRNWEELERKLKSKMPNLRRALVGLHPFWAGDKTTHRSLQTLIQTEARIFRPAPVPPPAPTPASGTASRPPAAPPNPSVNDPAPPMAPPNLDGKIVWEQPFALFHTLTHVEKWVPLTTPVTRLEGRAPVHQKIEWSYWLRQNNDGSYTLFWSATPKTKSPADSDPHVQFQLKDGFLPARLKIVLTENQQIGLFLRD